VTITDKIAALQRTVLFGELGSSELRDLAERAVEKKLAHGELFTNQQIAARIGSVREVVSRALTRLQNNNPITIDGRRIVVNDEAALTVFADG
jgi:DNA-binding GntR family transcriptional regulator